MTDEARMPQHLMNIRGRGTQILDPEGDVLSGLREARDLVERTVRDIHRRPETYGGSDLWYERSFEVTGQSGEISLEIAFPAVRSRLDEAGPDEAWPCGMYDIVQMPSYALP